jgi:RHS repeat-associated protein
MHALAPIAPAHALPRVHSRAQERLRASGQLWPGATVCKTASKKKISFSRRFPHARCALAQTVPRGNALFPVASLSGKTVGEYGNGGAASSGRTEYIWLPTDDGSAIPVALFRNNRYYNIHSDHLGTPRLVTDDQAKPVWQWAYSAFGDNKPTGILKATTNPNSAITNQPVLLQATGVGTTLNLRFPGQYADSETGHFYNYHRTLMPGGGRYTQPDPSGLDGGWSRFGYSNQNPINYYDPTGHVALPALASGLAIGGALVLMTPAGQDAAKGAANGAADEVEKHMSWLANKYKCIMPPKPPGMSLCEYWKSKKPKLKACIDSKQSWDDRWEPGRHNLDIKQMLAELANIEQKMERLCKEKDCP